MSYKVKVKWHGEYYEDTSGPFESKARAEEFAAAIAQKKTVKKVEIIEMEDEDA